MSSYPGKDKPIQITFLQNFIMKLYLNISNKDWFTILTKWGWSKLEVGELENAPVFMLSLKMNVGRKLGRSHFN